MNSRDVVAAKKYCFGKYDLGQMANRSCAGCIDNMKCKVDLTMKPSCYGNYKSTDSLVRNCQGCLSYVLCKKTTYGEINHPAAPKAMPRAIPEPVPYVAPLNEADSPYKVQVGGKHYKDAYPFVQPLEFMSKNKIGFTKANVCKYVLRHDSKNGIEDLRKAQHYLQVIAWDEYNVVL